jgi:hypothetical protein
MWHCSFVERKELQRLNYQLKQKIYCANAADAAMIFAAPAADNSLAQAFVVAPVVITSSTKRHAFPFMIFFA